MESVSDKIAAWTKRVTERAEDPAYKANAERFRETEAEAVQRENESRLALLAAGIPMTLWGAIREPRDTPALVAARDFLGSAPSFLALSGPAGRGKTFAASWAVTQKEGRYVITHDLVTAGSFASVWAEIALAPILALDELGAEYRNAAFEASLYSLLNARHAHGRKTILCTNLDAGGFVARYCPKEGDPLRDRLRTSSVWVSLPGQSLRKPWSDTDKDEDPPRDPDSGKESEP